MRGYCFGLNTSFLAGISLAERIFFDSGRSVRVTHHSSRDLTRLCSAILLQNGPFSRVNRYGNSDLVPSMARSRLRDAA